MLYFIHCYIIIVYKLKSILLRTMHANSAHSALDLYVVSKETDVRIISALYAALALASFYKLVVACTMHKVIASYLCV